MVKLTRACCEQLLHTIHLHRLASGMSRWVLLPGFLHLSLVVQVSQSSLCVQRVAENHGRF